MTPLINSGPNVRIATDVEPWPVEEQLREAMHFSTDASKSLAYMGKVCEVKWLRIYASTHAGRLCCEMRTVPTAFVEWLVDATDAEIVDLFVTPPEAVR